MCIQLENALQLMDCKSVYVCVNNCTDYMRSTSSNYLVHTTHVSSLSLQGM